MWGERGVSGVLRSTGNCGERKEKEEGEEGKERGGGKILVRQYAPLTPQIGHFRIR